MEAPLPKETEAAREETEKQATVQLEKARVRPSTHWSVEVWVGFLKRHLSVWVGVLQ